MSRPSIRRKHHQTEVPLPPPGRMSVSMEEAARLTSLSLTSIRRAVKAEKLKAFRFGARVIIRRPDLDAFISGLPQGLQNIPERGKRNATPAAE